MPRNNTHHRKETMYTKTRIWSVLLLALVIGVGRALGPMPTVTATQTSQHSDIVICTETLIPEGYVIVAYTYSIPNCPIDSTLQPNAWVIKIPGDVEEVCKGSPVPENYVIVTNTFTSDCLFLGAPAENAWIIQRV